jgi:nucleoside-diphosphate-sugar epimerase
MKPLHPFSVTREVTVRVVADILIINFALLSAVTLHFLYLIVVEGTQFQTNYTQPFWQHLATYLNTTWLLTPICLVAYWLNGFYTYGRAYKGHYKVLVICQATTVAYTVFGLITYFGGLDQGLASVILPVAWLLSIILVVTARLWGSMWAKVVEAELIKFSNPDLLPPPTVLVIGGGGYIGSALLPKLLNQGYRVRLLDLLLYGKEPIKDLLNHPRLELIQADFRQVDIVVKAMKGVDSVVHLGAIVGDPACALNEELTIEVNLMATRMIAEVAKGHQVKRFIFASTCSVYGVSDDYLDEESPLNPVSLYARSKIASERILQQMADESFSPVILRFGTIYGLSGRTRFDLVINLLTAMAVVEGYFTVTGGDQWRPFVHVDDAALAVFKALEYPQALVHNQIYNVGSDEQNFTLEQIGEMVKSLVPNAIFNCTEGGLDKRNYKVNFIKIKETLGFLPQYTVKQGIQQVIDAIESGKVKDYRDPLYSNVKFLSAEDSTLHSHHLSNWTQELLNPNLSPNLIS